MRSIFLHSYAAVMLIGASIFWLLNLIIKRPRTSIRDRLRSLRITDYALIGYLIIACISAYRSMYPYHVLYGVYARYDGLITQASYIALFFVFSRAQTLKPWHFAILGVSASLVCIIGIAQFFGYDFLELDPSGMTYHRRTFFTTFGHFDVTSTFTCMMIMLFAALTVTGHKARTYLFLIPTALCFVMQIILNTMASWVAVVGCAFVAIPVFLRTKRSFVRTMIVLITCGLAGTLYTAIYKGMVLQSASGYEAFMGQYLYMLVAAVVLLMLFSLVSLKWKPDRRLHIAWILLVYLIGLLALGYAYMKLRDLDIPDNLFHEIDQVLRGNFDDKYGSSRGYIWKRGITLASMHPWIGTGADTFGDAFYSMYGDESYMIYHVLFDKAHNEYLQILVTHGILGLGAYVVFIIGFFVQAIRNRDAVMKSGYGYGLLLVMIAYLIQATFTFSIPIVTPFFSIALGCGSSVCRRKAIFV